MRTVYMDASAVAKLVVREAESDALRAWLGDRPRLVSSALLRTELLRAVRRQEPGHFQRARQVILGIGLHVVDDDVLETAASLNPLALRTLDAIHLATALRVVTELDALVTYDGRMVEGAEHLGLPVASPA